MLHIMNTKTTETRTLRTVVGELKGDEDALLQILQAKYIGSGEETIKNVHYKSLECPYPDYPISKKKVFVAAMSRERRSAPGDD